MYDVHVQMRMNATNLFRIHKYSTRIKTAALFINIFNILKKRKFVVLLNFLERCMDVKHYKLYWTMAMSKR